MIEKLPIGNIPNFDPSVLTMQQIERAINNLESRINTRFNAMDKASDLFHENLTRIPTSVDRAVNGLQELLEAKIEITRNKIIALGEVTTQQFLRIDNSFAERDKRTDQLTLSNSTAIAAALQAQKEAAGETTKSAAAAINKSEASTADAIRQLQILFQTASGATNAKIDDVKSRLDRGEGGQQSTRLDSSDRRADNMNLIQLITMVAIIAGSFGAIIALFFHH